MGSENVIYIIPVRKQRSSNSLEDSSWDLEPGTWDLGPERFALDLVVVSFQEAGTRY
jgi:hypothetical protein